jgi:ribulose-phosphate 3-epimerase
MIEIIPAILTSSYSDIKNKVSIVKDYVHTVQVDICDGEFVQSKTWPFASGGVEDFDFRNIINEVDGMPSWQEVDFELDLMVKDAMENFDLYSKLGARRVIFHLDAIEDIETFKEFIEGMDHYIRDFIQIGLAINKDKDFEKINKIIYNIDFVQCMGIENIGKQGEPFNTEIVDFIKELKNKYEDIIISVDGGVNLENAPVLIDAGVSRLVVGSAIFGRQDALGAIEEFQNLL